jgi:beta-glucosidase-like glycosyl hydrolase/serine/threonine protein kinase
MMARQVIQRDRLGALAKIGQGGQGVVYRAPNVKTKFASSMVYKEYKAQLLAEIDFTALAAMPALVEESLSYADGERLVSVAAWPCAIVEDAGRSTGFVMPAIPQEFFISLTTVKGVSTSTAEFQHLLNHFSVLAARGITVDDAQRYSLLREVASGLAFLHKHGVCVGDISPKNLLFSLTPHEAVYFIDCDAMRINGVSALTQVETPGWTVPAGEELATVHSDSYKLGLLALRLLAGDHDTTNPAHLPSATPGLLRQIITETLTRQPQSRPLPEAWSYVLGQAIEEAQYRTKTAAPASAPLEAPEIPVVRSRPSRGSARARPSTPPPPPSAPPDSAPPASAPASSRTAIWAAVATVVAVIAVAAAVLANHTSGRDKSAPATSSAAQAIPPARPACGDPAAILSSMSTRDKLAQLLMVGVRSGDDAQAVVANNHVGGIFVGSWTDLSMLTNGMVKNLSASTALPVAVSVDEEGGRVARLSKLIGAAPSARVLAQTHTPDEVYGMALDRGHRMRGLGVTVDFAPDVDVTDAPDDTVIGDRSFGSDPATVTEYAGAYARGLRDAGLLPVLKHFPGHGHGSGDSHTGGVVTPPLAQLQTNDLVPYRTLVTASPVGVMVGHLQVPGLTGGEPASLSRAAVQLLRTGTGYNAPAFDGPVFTDDLSSMAAVNERYSVPEAVLRSLQAGADVALWVTTDEAPAVLDRLEKAVAAGELTMPNVDASVLRIAKFKGPKPDCGR